MTPPHIPEYERLVRRWQRERMLSFVGPVMRVVCVATLCGGLALLVVPTSQQLVVGMLSAVLALWLGGGVFLAWRYFKKPTSAALAKRADSVLGLPDDLLALSELPAPSSEWGEAAWQRTREQLASRDLNQVWPCKLSRASLVTAVVAVGLTAAVGWLGVVKLGQERARLAQGEAAQQVRIAAAEEVLQDWKEFVELTDDEELKKLFTEAGRLKEAMENRDPMAAMLEMNRIEEKMSALQETINKESLSAQAAQMAEAFEAFEGMGAMSAALRNQNFEAAEKEAEKLAAKLAQDPKALSELRRDAAVTEMLASESKTAASRGNQNLSEALSQMSEAASQAGKKGGVPNDQLCPPMKTLKDQFAQESSRQNRGRAASLSKNQMEALRRKLRGESVCDSMKMPSLCSTCAGQKPGGLKAGSSPGGPPQAEQTELAEAKVQESATGQQGEGESEVRTLSSTTGTGAAVGGGKKAQFSDYVELSQKAVADENLPLAHRRVIQTYFERIRPVAETTTP